MAFALKLSRCSTICYIFYHAVDWPGIGTSVTTVLIAGLSTTGAIKQRLIVRVVGAVIGGLILGLGATAFLFPRMDTTTSLAILVGGVAFLSAWRAAGRHFNYVGLQIAFSFYLVAFEGFSAPTKLAPARDRLIWNSGCPGVNGISFRPGLAGAHGYRYASKPCFLAARGRGYSPAANAADEHKAILKADGQRDRVGKTVAALRGLNDSVPYDFGTDLSEQTHVGEAIMRAAFSAAGMFWNQLSILRNEHDQVFLADQELIEMRANLSRELEAMAHAVVQSNPRPVAAAPFLADSSLLDSPCFGEYARNAVRQFGELQAIVCTLGSANSRVEVRSRS